MRLSASLPLIVTLCASGVALAQDAPIGLPTLIIKDVKGLPAACLPSGEAPVEMQGVGVGTLEGDWPSKEWAIVLQDHAKPIVLKAGECVTYRQTLPGYKQVGADQPLEVGETYAFSIVRTNSSLHWTDRLHLGVFCIDQQPGGSRRYLPYVQHDDGSAAYPSCGRYIGWKPAADGIVPSGYPSTTRQPDD
jgi:hypothetical protein